MLEAAPTGKMVQGNGQTRGSRLEFNYEYQPTNTTD